MNSELYFMVLDVSIFMESKSHILKISEERLTVIKRSNR